jgi:RNA polymerase sigma-54 factor
MTQYDIAKKLNMHPSTVSRASRNKYLLCQQGLFPVSHFFSRKVGQGPDAPSESLIKQQISQLISMEHKGKPLSDQMLTSLLQKNNIQVSRRTVAKYRSEMGLRSSYQRKIKKGNGS